MKKIFAIALMTIAILFVGCGGSKSVNESASEKVDAVLVAGSFWVLDAENMPYLADALNRDDREYLNQLMLEGKVFKVAKDTNVIRLGVAANENNVLIEFKEGRYTNKSGCTFKSNVVAKDEFAAYAENRTKKKFALIQDCLSNTEKYSEVIATGDVKKVEQFCAVCLDNRNKLANLINQEKEKVVVESAYMASDIILERLNALGVGKDEAERRSQRAEKLRQEFRAKYGF